MAMLNNQRVYGGILQPRAFIDFEWVSPKFRHTKISEKRWASLDTTWVSEHGTTASNGQGKNQGKCHKLPPQRQEGVRSELLPAVLAATESLLKAGRWGTMGEGTKGVIDVQYIPQLQGVCPCMSRGVCLVYNDVN